MDRVGVVGVLGQPQGSVDTGFREILIYPHGEVVLEEGIVVALALEDAEIWEMRQQRLAEAREQQLREGKRIRDEALHSPRIQELSSERQADFWREFQRRYPEIEIPSEILALIWVEDRRILAENAERERRAVEERRKAAEVAMARALGEARERQERNPFYGLTPQRYYSHGSNYFPKVRSHQSPTQPGGSSLSINIGGGSSSTQFQWRGQSVQSLRRPTFKPPRQPIQIFNRN